MKISRVCLGFLICFPLILECCYAVESPTNVVAACTREIQLSIKKSGVDYLQGLTTIANDYQRKGALEELMLVRAEENRFKKESTLEIKNVEPKCPLLKDWQKKVIEYQTQVTRPIIINWLNKLERQKVDLTRAGKIEDALTVKQSIDLLREAYQPDNQSANKKMLAPANIPVPAQTNPPIPASRNPIQNQSGESSLWKTSESDRAFDETDWIKVGDWSLKKIKAAPETTPDWHEMKFDVSEYARRSGPVYIWFRYASYASPRIAKVRLFVDGAEVSSDRHTCNPISHREVRYKLALPATRSGAKVYVHALFNVADGYGNVYIHKEILGK